MMDYPTLLLEVITYLPEQEITLIQQDGQYVEGVWTPLQTERRCRGYARQVSDKTLLMDMSGTFIANDVLCYIPVAEKFAGTDTPAVLQERDRVKVQGIPYVVIGVKEYDQFGFRRYHLRREKAEISDGGGL